MNSALIYFGGKWKSAKWIIQFFPKHDLYVEPFGGAASVLLQKTPAKMEIYNDLSSDVYNFFWVLRNKPTNLIKRISRTPFSREQFNKRFAHLKNPNRVIRAWAFLYASYMGIGGAPITNRKTGYRGNTKRYETSIYTVWKGVPNNLIEVAERLRRVNIHNRDYAWILQQYDSKKTLFYIDPPYVHSTRKSKVIYNKEMENHQQRELVNKVCNLQGYVILSGYDNKIYKSLEERGWKKFCRRSRDQRKNIKTECVVVAKNFFAI